MTQKPLVCHLIQRDGIGGVETAARSMLGRLHDAFEFRLVIMEGECLAANTQEVVTFENNSINNPISYFKVLRYLMSEKPDVLICSLWRMMMVGIPLKLLSGKTKIVCFLHNAENAHLPDRIVTYFATRILDHIWLDSEATGYGRLNERLRKSARKISFMTDRFQTSEPKARRAEAKFISWGRMAKVKRFDKVIKFVADIVKKIPDTRLDIYGPDGGEQASLEKLIADRDLQDVVKIHPPVERIEFEKIAKDKSFFIQLSDREGMAMAVTEAMSLGLVPVVTPVGEIANYCTDGLNAVFVEKEIDSPSVDDLLNLLQDQMRYGQMSQQAAATWEQASLYHEDVAKTVGSIL